MPHNHLLAIVVPVLERGTSLNLRDFQNSPPDTKKAIEDLFVNLLLFLVVSYSCARYAVGIEHPWRWYRETRMRNYNRLS